MLWIERYSPKKLQELSYNSKITDTLSALSKSKDFPHLLFHGPSGAGKRSRIKVFLQSLYGDKVLHLKGETREFKKSSGSVECVIVSSPFHIEVTPSDVGINDKIVVQQLIKEVASSQILDVQILGPNEESKQKLSQGVKVIVLHQVDLLTHQAQAGLRRTMEKYMSNCRILMDCECVSKVIAPLRSRVMKIKVSAPTEEEIVNVLTNIANKEKLNPKENTLETIAKYSGRNLRRAIMVLQSSWNCVTKQAISSSGNVVLPPYELHIRSIVKDMVADKSVGWQVLYKSSVIKIRAKLYEALVKLIPATTIFRLFIKFLQGQVAQSTLVKIMPHFAIYEQRCRNNLKDLYHLEAAVVKFMSLQARG